MNKLLLIVFIVGMFSGCNDPVAKNRYRPSGSELSKQVYKVGIHPYLNSKKMYTSYRPILDYIESHFDGVHFVLETSANYNNYNQKLYRGDFHFSLPNPFQTYNALSHHYHVIAKMKPDSVFRGIFVARKDSYLKDVWQVKGKAISFPAPTALAATMMPLYYLYEHGIDVEKDIEKRYVGSQYSSILNAYSSDTIAGATWPPPWEEWAKEYPKKAAEMEVVWQTKPLVNNGFVVRDDVDKEVAKKVATLLVQLSNNDKGKALLRSAGFEGFEDANDTTYERVKTFLQLYDKAIGIPQ